ncbi:MAG: polysaccharide biosynthesis/export family protein [Pseudomonadota bacterium]
MNPRWLLAACLFPGACASTAHDPAGAGNWSVPEPPGTYLLAPGDTVDLVFHSAPELNRTATIAPDGTLHLPFIEPVPAMNTSPLTLKARLETAFATQLVDPALDVLPVSQTPPRIYVGGAVASPGAFDLAGPTDPLQALILAGGETPEADMASVVFMRRDAEGTIRTRRLDVRAGVDDPGSATWPRLQRFDVLYVPRSRIADQNRLVTQYIRNALPLDFFLIYDVATLTD